jgi:predicted metalloprotease with PDZ domain
VLVVNPGSPADRAGLAAGDKIIAVGNEAVKSFQDVVRIVTSHKPGEKLEIVFERDGLQGVVDAVLGSEVDAFGRRALPVSNSNSDNPEWPAGYQPSRMESMPYQS